MNRGDCRERKRRNPVEGFLALLYQDGEFLSGKVFRKPV